MSIYILHDLGDLDLKPEAVGDCPSSSMAIRINQKSRRRKNGVLYFNPGTVPVLRRLQFSHQRGQANDRRSQKCESRVDRVEDEFSARRLSLFDVELKSKKGRLETPTLFK